MENTQKIYEILTKYGAKVDKNFALLFERGYGSDSCQELSDEIVGYLRNIAISGLNNGKLDRTAKDCAKELAKTAVALSDKNAPKRLPKYRETVSALALKAGQSALNPTYAENTMIGSINRYLQTSIDGALTVRNMVANSPEKVEVLDKIVDRLEKIKTNFEKTVYDNVSANACAIEKAIVDEIVTLRKKMQSKMINRYCLDHLDKIEVKINEWALLQGVDRKNPKAKDTDIATYVEDNLTSISESDETIANAETFFGNIDEYNAQTEQLCSTTKLDEEITAEQEALAKEQAQLDNIASRILNGEDPVRLFREKQLIEQRMASRYSKIERFNEQINDKLEMHSMRNETAMHLEKVRNDYERAKHSPAMVYELFKNTDFTRLTDLLDPTTNPSAIRDTVREMYDIFIRNQIIDENGDIQRKKLDELEKMLQDKKKVKNTATSTTSILDQKSKGKQKQRSNYGSANYSNSNYRRN